MTPSKECFGDDIPRCVLCGEPADEEHHIFRKRKSNPIFENPMNKAWLCRNCHKLAQFIAVQATAVLLFKVQIKRYGQAFIDYADKIGHKTWVNR